MISLFRAILLASLAIGFVAISGVAVAAAEHEAPDPLSVDPDLAIWTVVVFGFLFFILSKFAWGPISEALEKREHTIAHHIDEAGRKHDEAKQLLADYEQRLASAADQVRAMLDEARRDAEHAKSQIIAEAKASAEAERVRALRDIDTATDAALNQLAERSANMAVELAGKIVGARLKQEDHLRLIQEASAKLASAKPSSN